MAEHLDMSHLSLNDSKHAVNGLPNGSHATYVPPHLRQARIDGATQGNPSPGVGGSAWNNPQ